MTSGRAVARTTDRGEVARVLAERQCLSRIQKEQEEKDRCVWVWVCPSEGAVASVPVSLKGVWRLSKRGMVSLPVSLSEDPVSHLSLYISTCGVI